MGYPGTTPTYWLRECPGFLFEACIRQLDGLEAERRLADIDMLLAGTGKLKPEAHRQYVRQLQVRATQAQETRKMRPKSAEDIARLSGGQIAVEA